MKYVNSTITTTEAHCMIANFTTNSITERIITLIGSYETPEAVKKAVNERGLQGMDICGKVLDYTEKTAKYTMNEARFHDIAKPVGKRSNGAYVFRTVKTMKQCAIVYDIEENTTFETTSIFTKKALDKNAMRKQFTQYETERYSVVGVKTLDTIEACYEVSAIDFIKNAESVESL